MSQQPSKSDFGGLPTSKIDPSHKATPSLRYHSLFRDIVWTFDGLLTQKRGLPSDFQILDGLLIRQSDGLLLDFEGRFPV
jgi:hypothetical protein